MTIKHIKFNILIFIVTYLPLVVAAQRDDCANHTDLAQQLISFCSTETYSAYSPDEFVIERGSVCKIRISPGEEDENFGTGVIITDNTNSEYYLLTAAHVVALNHTAANLDPNSDIPYKDIHWGVGHDKKRVYLNFNFEQDNCEVLDSSACLLFIDVQAEMVFINVEADIALFKINDSRIKNDSRITASAYWDYWNVFEESDFLILHHPLSLQMKVTLLNNINFISANNQPGQGHFLYTSNLGTNPSEGMVIHIGSSGSALINRENHAVVSTTRGIGADDGSISFFSHTTGYSEIPTNQFQYGMSHYLKTGTVSSKYRRLYSWATPAVVKKNITLQNFLNDVKFVNIVAKNNATIAIATNRIRGNFYYEDGSKIKVTPVRGRPTVINPKTTVGPSLPSGSDRSQSSELSSLGRVVDSKFENKLKIFPNPTLNDFEIQLTTDLEELKGNNVGKMRIQIFNKINNLVYTVEEGNPNKVSDNTISVRIPSEVSTRLIPGVYHIVVEFNNKKYFKKLIKQ